jgi:hypothetical protein
MQQQIPHTVREDANGFGMTIVGGRSHISLWGFRRAFETSATFRLFFLR